MHQFSCAGPSLGQEQKPGVGENQKFSGASCMQAEQKLND